MQKRIFLTVFLLITLSILPSQCEEAADLSPMATQVPIISSNSITPYEQLIKYGELFGVEKGEKGTIPITIEMVIGTVRTDTSYFGTD